MKIALCDDNPNNLTTLANVLTSFRPNAKITLFASSSELEASTDDYDVIYLNVDMESHRGLDAAVYLRVNRTDTSLVIYSRYEDARDTARKIYAKQFLTVPLDKDDILDGLRQIEGVAIGQKQFVFSTHTGKRLVKSVEILYLESQRNDVVIHLSDCSTVDVRSTLNDMLYRLGYEDYVKTHRSYAVPVAKIVEVSQDFVRVSGSDDLIPLSRTKKKEVDNKFVDEVKERAILL
ncbi:MAG: LytTR family transcriptional regulator DNA-binding domain-containing protein [Eubacterium sp.]|nr:LytTR family transcriptional regulator DNA-binding domain-containing protein [Eubacterium sp.]